jgi:hypothetical protein
LQQDLEQQGDLQVVPGEDGVQVYANGEYVPVTAQRRAALPSASDWSYPKQADVAGWRPALSSLSRGTPAHGAVGTGTVYAGYAPRGRFPLTLDGRAVSPRPAFGWAAQYSTRAGHASLSFSSFPYVPLAVSLELLVWVLLAGAVLGLSHRRARTAALHLAGERS